MSASGAVAPNPGDGNCSAGGVFGLAGLGFLVSAREGDEGVTIGKAIEDALCVAHKGSLQRNAALDHLS